MCFRNIDVEQNIIAGKAVCEKRQHKTSKQINDTERKCRAAKLNYLLWGGQCNCNCSYDRIK